RLQARPRRPLVRRQGNRLRAPQARSPRPAPGCGEDPRRHVRADRAARLGDRPPSRGGGARAQDEDADRRARRLRPVGARAQRLPRARARPLLGDVEDVHRPHLRALRAQEHRGRRGREQHGLPAALGRVRGLGRPRSDRPGRHDVLRADPRNGRGSPGLERPQGGEDVLDRADRRLDRVAVGAADRELRAGDRVRVEAAGMIDAAVERRAGSAVARPRPRALTVTALGGAALFLVGALLVGTAVGPVHVGVGAIAESALSHIPFLGFHSHLTSTQDAIVWQLRFPRVILGALVGGMLALGGASYQGVFRNPLADPYLLGGAAGAGLGATLAVAYLPHGFGAHDALPPAAFAGAIVAVAIAYAIGRAASPRSSGAALVLAGVTVV